MSNQYGPRIVTDGLVLCLDAANRKSYPGTGSTWYDLSGRNNHVVADATYSPSYNSNGYFTFGGGDNFETRSAAEVMNSQITMICWYNQTGNGNGAPRLIETHMLNSTFSYSNAICVDTDSAIRAWIDINGTSSARRESRDTVSGTAYPKNNWRMVAYTYSGVAGSSTIYVNGSAVSANEVSGTVSNANIDDINIITIGAYADGHTANYFQGHIAICQIYSSALSASEILQNYNATKGRFGL